MTAESEHPSRGNRARLAIGLAVAAAATAVAFVAEGVLSSEDHDDTAVTVSADGRLGAETAAPSGDPGATSLSELTFDRFDGSTGSIADYAGAPLVVNFFASWCPPCVREMPEFQEVFESLEGRVAFLGLSQDSAAQDALNLVDTTGVTYDVGWDLDLEVYKATGSIAMPTTAFVSPSGELLDTFAGVLDAESLAERINDSLGVAAGAPA